MKKLLLSLGTAIGTLGVTALAAGTVIAYAPDPVEEIQTVLTLHVEGYVNIENSSDPEGEFKPEISGSYFSRVTLVEEMNEKTASAIADKIGIDIPDGQTAKGKLLEESHDFEGDMGEFEYTHIYTGATIEGNDRTGGEILPDHYLGVKPQQNQTYQFGFYKHSEVKPIPDEDKIYWINVEFDETSTLESENNNQNI